MSTSSTPTTTPESLTIAQEIKKGEEAGDLNDTSVRYLAYLGRLRPLVQPYTRYLAYASEAGESFRPLISPSIVTAAYTISWLYLAGDVGYEGYKARLKSAGESNGVQGTVVGLTMVKRAVFQSTASMLLPALTVHSIVKYSALGLKRTKLQNPRIKSWAPTLLGLAIVPALPWMYDEPVERVTESVFDVLENQFIKDERIKSVLHAGRGEHEQ